jgi:hypothetical protein
MFRISGHGSEPAIGGPEHPRAGSLHVVGRAPAPTDPKFGAPHGGIAIAIVNEMQREGWQPKLNQLVDGADYAIIAPDGRDLHINTIPAPACNQVEVTIDAR